jgi:fatty acid desaturase
MEPRADAAVGVLWEAPLARQAHEPVVVGASSGAPPRPGWEYAALKRLVAGRGLLEPRPGYYLAHGAAMFLLLAAGLACIALAPSLPARLLISALLGVVMTQIAFIAHDLGHRQVLRRAAWRDAAGLLIGNLVLGISRAWWIDKHNAHHAHPNEVDADPDIDLPFVAFSESQVAEKRGLGRLMVAYQAYLLFPLVLLGGAVSWRIYSLHTVFARRVRHLTAERVLLAGFFIWYAGFFALFVGGWEAALLVFAQQGAMGLNMGSVFAPNHKGMLVLEPGTRLDFLRQQVLTSRNVRPGPLTDFLYGGLNYQIEHHLFPTMPRPSLAEARLLVREFCRQHGIGYHETGVRQSFAEVLRYLHEVGAPLRRRA